jgi:hypothetical protein
MNFAKAAMKRKYLTHTNGAMRLCVQSAIGLFILQHVMAVKFEACCR